MILVKDEIAEHVHAPERNGLRHRPLHRASRGSNRKALRGAPEGTGGVVVGKAGVGMHITDDMNRFRHMAQAGNFRVKADRNVNVILAG